MFRGMEPAQGSGWLHSGSEDPCCRMEFLFHGGRSQGDVLRLTWSSEDSERIEADLREGQAATVQWVGSNSNRGQTFPRCALRNYFCPLAPYATKLLSRQRRGARDVQRQAEWAGGRAQPRSQRVN